MTSDEKMTEEIYKYPMLKTLFVILSYDPKIPEINRIYFSSSVATPLEQSLFTSSFSKPVTEDN